MYKFIFSQEWKQSFKWLSSSDQSRVQKKLEYYKSVPSILPHVKKLTNFHDATHRLRIWDIRIVLEKLSDTDFKVINIWYRWDIYK